MESYDSSNRAQLVYEVQTKDEKVLSYDKTGYYREDNTTNNAVKIKGGILFMKTILNKVNEFIDNLNTSSILENLYGQYKLKYKFSKFQFPFDNYAWKDYEESYNNKINHLNNYYGTKLAFVNTDSFKFQKTLETLKLRSRKEIPRENKDMLELLKSSQFDNPVIKSEIQKLEKEIANNNLLHSFYNRFIVINNINILIDDFEAMMLKVVFKKFNELMKEKCGYFVKYETKNIHKDYNEYLKTSKLRDFNSNMKEFFENYLKYSLISYKVINNNQYNVIITKNNKDNFSINIIIKDLLASEKMKKLVNFRNNIMEMNPKFAEEIRFLEKINSKKYDNKLVTNYINHLVQNETEEYIENLKLYLAINSELSKINHSEFLSVFSQKEMMNNSFKENILENVFNVHYTIGEKESQLSQFAGVAGIPESYKGYKEKFIKELRIGDLILLSNQECAI